MFSIPLWEIRTEERDNDSFVCVVGGGPVQEGRVGHPALGECLRKLRH